ncbi:MAG: PAS domain S-box protein [Betaproteobacteria bacterium]|nr:PAS domain S-box protein [Betaproteobacteria bacterium]
MKRVQPHAAEPAAEASDGAGDAAAKLRRRAMELLQARPQAAAMPLDAADTQRLLHELQVQQIELELQNEELRRSRAEIEAALVHFADFYDFSPAGFFSLDRDGVIGRLNLTGARLLGLERSRLVGRQFSSFVAEADRPLFNAFLQGVFAGGAGQSCELKLAIDGQWPQSVQITAPLSADGQECRIVAVDITERQRAAEQLRESHQFTTEIINNAQEGIVVYGPDLRYRLWNDYMENFTGMRSADVLGRHPLEVFPFLKDSGVIANLEDSLAGGVARCVEFPFEVKQTGRSGWALDRNAPLRNARGEIVGVIGTVSDITERKMAEEALKSAQQRFRDIVNATDGIVWEADATTLVTTFVSKQAERLLGYPLEAWEQPDFLATHLHPADKDWAFAYISSSIPLMKPFELEYRFIAQDGREVWLHDMINVVEENGAPRWLRGITVDITQRRQAEDKLVLLAESLETRVVERTKELRRVSAQLTMIEERERRMLAEDLHDNLGQLLAVIKIKLTSLSDDAPHSSIRQVVELGEQADLAARSITLQLSPPILRTLGLAPALDWLGDEIERLYGLRVHTDLGECSRRLIDEVQAVLYRSARELLINVAKHAKVQEANLTCLCDHGRLVLVVSDAGEGFSPAEHFGASHGHGSFGLRSIRERIVNLGGEVDIDSSPGNGTTITLSVPRFIEGKEICDDPNNACR